MSVFPHPAFSQAEALFFDFDGTLVDSVPDLALAINNTLTSLGREPFAEHEIRQWVGNGPEQLVARALSGSVEIDPALEASLLESSMATYFGFYERDICVNTRLYPEVENTLKQLKQKFPMVIITNKTERFVAPILKGLGLDGIFDVILGGDSLPQRKPNPAPLLHAADTLGKTVQQCVMIGDSKNDILAAKAAQMSSVGVSYGYNYGEPIAVYEPDAVVDDFSTLVPLLGEIA